MWTPERVIDLLSQLEVNGVCRYQDAYACAHSLPTMARRLFGSFESACLAAGLKSALQARPRHEVCSVAGCGERVRTSGSEYCEMHYMRHRRNGHLGLKQVSDLSMHSHGYLMVYAPMHPLATRQGRCREYQHRVVYFNQYGEGPFLCHWCAKVVTWSDMHVDHVNDIKSDNRIENLVASCPRCNTWRNKDKNLDSLRKSIGRHVTHDGETKTISEWARRIGISRSALIFRLKRGWPLDVALNKSRGIFGPAGHRAGPIPPGGVKSLGPESGDACAWSNFCACKMKIGGVHYANWAPLPTSEPRMQKSTLIANCLLNSSMVTSLAAGEKIVQSVFDEYFEGQDFAKWNTSIADGIARSIIDGVGRAKQINVRQFIADLGSDPDQSADSQSQPRATDNPAQPRSEATRDGNPGGKLNGRT